jgi:hypothetical protein
VIKHSGDKLVNRPSSILTDLVAASLYLIGEDACEPYEEVVDRESRVDTVCNGACASYCIVPLAKRYPIALQFYSVKYFLITSHVMTYGFAVFGPQGEEIVENLVYSALLVDVLSLKCGRSTPS